jgi:hypothetical protein
MKDIKDMNLAELADLNPFYLSEKDWRNTQSRLRDLHDLTRWIPVSERLPTEADADKYGEVMWLYRKHGAGIGGWDEYRDSVFTHWKRINPPEGK